MVGGVDVFFEFFLNKEGSEWFLWFCNGRFLVFMVVAQMRILRVDVLRAGSFHVISIRSFHLGFC